MSKLEIKYVNIDDVIPYENNPRHNEEAIPLVMNSIKEFGFINPIILDKENVIVAGHTRLEAAKRLELKEVPVLYVDELNEQQIKAFRLADNKVAEASKWNAEQLELELADILDINMEDFGFNLDDSEEMINEVLDDEEPEIEFTEILGEQHNYIVLYFDNEVDWLQAESLFDLKPVYNLSTRKDGEISEGMKTTGIGRVLNGAKAINKLLGEDNED